MHATTILTQGDGANICATNEIYELYRRSSNRLKYQVRSCSDSSCTTGSPPWVGTDGTNQTYFSEAHNNAVPNDSGDLTFLDSVNIGLPIMSFSSFPSLTASIIPLNRYFQYRAIFESNDTLGSCSYSSSSGLPCSPELKSVTAGPNHYDISSPTLISNQGVSFYNLSSFLQTLGSGGCGGGVLYNIGSSSSGPWMYWNGSAWATANAATVVNTSIASFGSLSQIYFKAFFQSSGTSGCELNQVSLGGTD